MILRFPRRIRARLPGSVVPGDGDKSPFLALADNRGEPAGKAALVLHGFSGTPFEVRPLAEGLAARGYTALAPLLAGHGRTVADLAQTRWPDWFASAERALDQLLAETGGRPVAVVGFSLGGLLALRLARVRPQHVTTLAVLSVPLRLQLPQALAVRLVSALPRWLQRGPLFAWPKLQGYDVVDAEARRRNPGLEALPLAGVASMLELAGIVRQDLPHVKVPTLVAHGDLDRTVPFSDALEVVGGLGSSEIARCWLPGSGHLIVLDVDRATLIDAVARFFDRHRSAGADASHSTPSPPPAPPSTPRVLE